MTAVCRNCGHPLVSHAEGPTRTGGLVDWPCAFPDCPCADYEEARA